VVSLIGNSLAANDPGDGPREAADASFHNDWETVRTPFSETWAARSASECLSSIGHAAGHKFFAKVSPAYASQ
jgi:hypothetical protein